MQSTTTVVPFIVKNGKPSKVCNCHESTCLSKLFHCSEPFKLCTQVAEDCSCTKDLLLKLLRALSTVLSCCCHCLVLCFKVVPLWESVKPQTNILVSLQTTQRGYKCVFLSADIFCSSTPAVPWQHASVFWYDAGRRRLVLIFQRAREAPGCEMGAQRQPFGPPSIPRQGLMPASIAIQTSASPLYLLQALQFHNKHSWYP